MNTNEFVNSFTVEDWIPRCVNAAVELLSRRGISEPEAVEAIENGESLADELTGRALRPDLADMVADALCIHFDGILSNVELD
jgi:hypothetical protein